MSRGYAPRKVFDITDLLAPCWCEATMRHIPRAMVAAGETISCGAPECHPSTDDHQKAV